MQFSVIYSVDVPEGVSVRNFAPPQVGRLWTLTESGESEYSYLEGRWEKGKHRKWTALLSRKQFDAFVNKLGLYAESTETMGSLGAPGFGFGWSPAISFNADHEDAIVNAYVTPIPETSKVGGDEHDGTEFGMRSCRCTGTQREGRSVDIAHFKQAVERHWKHHAPCEHLLWKIKDDGDEWRIEAAPVYQEVVGGDQDGQRVWSGFDFDVSGFLAEPGVVAEGVVASSYCIECSETPFIGVRGEYRGEAFFLAIHLEPIPGSAPAEAIDTLTQRVRAIGEK